MGRMDYPRRNTTKDAHGKIETEIESPRGRQKESFEARGKASEDKMIADDAVILSE